MAQYDGSIRINTEINAKNAESQLSSLENRMKKTADKISSLRSKMESLKDVKIPTQEYKEVQKQIEATEKKINDLVARQEKFLATGGKESSSTFKRMQYDLDELRNSLPYLKGELQYLVEEGKAFTLGKDTEEYAKLRKQLKYAENDMDLMQQKHSLMLSKQVRSTNEFKKTAQETGKVAKNTSSVNSELGKTNKSSLELNKRISSISSSLKGTLRTLTGSVQNIDKGFSALRNSLGGLLGSLGLGLGISGLIALGKQAIDTASDIQEVQNVVDTAFGSMSYKMEEFAKTSVKQFGISQLSAKQLGSTFMAMGKSMLDSAENASNMAINLTARAADMASFYNKSIEETSTALKSIYTGETESLKEYGVVMTQVNLQEFARQQGISKSIQKMTQAEKVELQYAYVMKQTSLAAGDFAKTSGSWANQTRILSEQFKELLSVLGSGLITVLTPVVKFLNTILGQLIAMAKQIGAVLLKLFGISVPVADASKSMGGMAGSAGDLSDDMDSASDSAGNLADGVEKAKKEAQKALAPFDKLNVLTKETASSSNNGSSGNGGGGGSINIPTVDMSEAEETEGAIEKIKTDISSLYELGDMIGQKLIEAMKSIPWDDVYSAADNFGSGLAQFLNGLISPELFGTLGDTIASSLNTALHFLDSFGETFDWKNFGKSISTSVNSFFKTFDWELAADTFNTLASGILDAVIEAVNGVDWKQVRDKIVKFINKLDFKGIAFKLGNLANALANALYTLVSDKKTWKTLGKKIADGINGFFKGMNKVDKNTGLNGWEALGKSISDTITGIADMLIEAMNSVDWEAVGQAIADFIGSIDWSGIAWKVDGVIDSLSKAIADALEGATGIDVSADAVNIVLEVGLFNWAFKKITGTSILGSIAGAVKEMLKAAGILSSSGTLTFSLAGISNFLVQVGAALSFSFPSPAVDDIVRRVETWFTDKVWKPLCRKVSWLDENSEAGVFQIILTPIMEIVGGLGNWFKDLWEDTTAVTDAIDVGNDVANGILQGIADALVLPVMFVYNLLIKPIMDALGIHSPSTVARDDIGKNIGNGILGGIELIKDKIVKTAENIWSNIKSPFLTVGSWFEEKFSGAYKKIKNAFSGIGGWFGNKWDAIKKVFTSGDGVSGWFKSKFDGAYKKVTGAFSGVSNFFGGVWSNIKGAFGNITEWFRTKFSKAWEAVKKVFSTGGKVFSGIKDGILSGLKSVINALIGGINKVITIPFNGINAALKKLKNLSIVGQKPFGFLPTISVPQIPKLANGAVIRGGDPFMAVLGDQPRGQTNIETPLPTMIKAFKQAMAESGGMGAGNITVQAILDGKVIYEETVKQNNIEIGRTGRNRLAY